MKTLALFLIVASFFPLHADAHENYSHLYSESELVSESEVVFRHNQRLRSRDGREIYLYNSGKCEMYYNDRLEVSCEYSVIGNEIRLIDNGRVIYKGSFTYESDHQTLSSLSIAGTIYFKK